MVKKRTQGNGEGSIYQRKDGLFCGAVTVGYDERGKIRRKVVYAKTRTEVAAKKVKLLHDIHNNVPVNTERLTLGVYLERWLENSVKPSVRDSTFRSYRSHTNNHLIPSLGRIQLDRLTPDDVERMMHERRKMGLSPRTVQYLRAILRRALAHRVKSGRLTRNVAALADAPRVERHEIEPFSEAEARQFLAAIRGHRHEGLYLTAIGTGLRQGELLGLTWDDVNLGERTLTVRRQLQRTESGARALVPLKTERSRRTLDIPIVVADALNASRVAQKEDRLAAGPRWIGNRWGLVFTTSLGTPLDPSNVTHAFQRELAKAGMRPQRFHDLRHCAASLWLAGGEDLRSIMESLGHSTITLTANTYSHLAQRARRRTADVMDAALTGTD